MQSSVQESELSTRYEKLNLLFEQSYPAVFISFINGLLLTGILWAHLNHNILLGWLGILIFTSFIRAILFISYRQIHPSASDISFWEISYFITLLMSASVWGIGCLFLIIESTTFYQSTIYIFLIGMAGAAFSVYSAVRHFVLSATAVVLLPVTIWFLLSGEMPMTLLGIGGSILFLSGIYSTKILKAALNNSFLTHQLEEAKEEAEKLASIDILTGLKNRGSFTELAEMQIQYCQRHHLPASVIVLDVDHFKDINDTKGHYVGDLALQHFSNILQKSTRGSDICGRIGGEEFAIFLSNTGATNASIVAENIRKAIEALPVETEDDSFNITASLGIVTGNEDLESMLKMADKAMYHAKESGRNQVFHYDYLNAQDIGT